MREMTQYLVSGSRFWPARRLPTRSGMNSSNSDELPGYFGRQLSRAHTVPRKGVVAQDTGRLIHQDEWRCDLAPCVLTCSQPPHTNEERP